MLLILSCWKKQSHEITAPETPVYNMHGSVVCSYYGIPLEDVDVTLMGVIKFNNEDSSRTLMLESQTDGNGIFRFSGVPGGFEYVLSASAEGYQQGLKKIVTYYQDKDAGEIVLGKLLVEHESVYLNDVSISGIAFRDGHVWIADTLKRRLYELNDDFTIQKYLDVLYFTPAGLAWDGSQFWTSDEKLDKVYRFIVNDAVEFTESYNSPHFPDNPNKKIDLLDIFYFGDELWSCSETVYRKYFRFDPLHPDSVTYMSSPLSTYEARGVAVDEDEIFLACDYKQDYRLYIVDRQTNAILRYSIIPQDAGYIIYDGFFIVLAKNNCISKYTFN